MSVVSTIMLKYPDYPATKLRELVKMADWVQSCEGLDKKQRHLIVKRLEEFHMLSAQTEALCGVIGGERV